MARCARYQQMAKNDTVGPLLGIEWAPSRCNLNTKGHNVRELKRRRW